MQKFRTAAIAALLVMTLGLEACSSSEVVRTLDQAQIVTDIASVLVSGVCSVAGSLGPVEAAICAVAPKYLSEASAATATCATEVASTDSNAMKYEACVNAYALATIPNLPAGTPPAVSAALGSVGSLIHTILTLLKPGTAVSASLKTMKRPGMLERHKLHSIAARADKTAKNMKALQALHK